MLKQMIAGVLVVLLLLLMTSAGTGAQVSNSPRVDLHSGNVFHVHVTL